MNEVFLEIVTAKFTAADFEKHQLSMPAHHCSSDLKILFLNEKDYNAYLGSLEKEYDRLLSQYWMQKSSELMNKNKFIIKVITVLRQEYSKKNHSLC